jgi:hypothetical protein
MTDAMTRISEESKVLVTHESTSLGTYQIWMPENLPRFAELIRAEEREACAKVCDAECNPTPHEGHITTYQSGGYIMAEYLASAIRARGQS